MRVVYDPENGDRQEWDFDPDRVLQVEAEMIEKRYGDDRKFDVWLKDLNEGGAKAKKVLLWHLMRRTHHTLRYEDVPNFYMGEVRFDYSLSELAEARERILKLEMSEERRQILLAEVDSKMTELIDRGELEGSGKAPSNESVSTTG